MKRFSRFDLFSWVLLFFVWSVFSCSSTTPKPAVDNGGGVQDSGVVDPGAPAPDQAATPDQSVGPDQGSKADQSSSEDSGLPNPDASSQADMPAPACPGAMGCSCAENSDCVSGFCVPSGDGPVCSQTCVDECPDEFACVAVEQVGQDPVFLCLSITTNLCRPCSINLDCREGSADTSARCLSFGAEKGSFCGIDCSNGEACPDGYGCEAFLDPIDGQAINQCIPLSGDCACNAKASLDEAFTPCSKGQCPGQRMCTSGGLTECDAQESTEELCDDLDNDCDGSTDEDFLTGGFYVHPEHCGACGNNCLDAFENGTGTCGIVSDLPGCVVQTCDDGYVKVSSTECAPIAEGLCDPCSSNDDCLGEQQCVAVGVGSFCVEACDVANDLCADGFTCTAIDADAWCLLDSGGCSTVGSSCVVSTECEDLNACTDDGCTEGTCVHSVKICDDANSCSVDSCDTATGCVFETLADNTACDDGDGCTQGELCVSGVCEAGAAVDCSDAFACTADSCVANGSDDYSCENELFADTCLIEGQCYGADTANSENACLSCIPGTSATAWSQLSDGTLCNDGNSCSIGDSCQSGVCTGALNTECTAGALEVEDCGLCGTRTRVCADLCLWGEWSACEAEGPCSPGDVTTQACGNCGTRTTVCQSDCNWGAFGECLGQTGCTPGQVFSETQSVSCGLCGSQSQERSRTCSDTCGLPEWGPWVDVGSCNGEGSCNPGAVENQTQSVSCGLCGSQAQTRSRQCNSSCSWSDWGSWSNVGTCSGQGTCTPGQTLEVGCGNCGTQVAVCQSDCNWGGLGACVGSGECSAAEIQTETSQIACGNCGVQHRERSRVCTGSCSFGAWGAWINVGGCQGSQECAQGSSEIQTQEVPCGQCGSQTQERARTCGFGCNWGAFGAWSNVGGCDGQGACEVGQTNTQTQFVGCGNCGEQQQQRTQTCTSTCNWGGFGGWSNVGGCVDQGVCAAGATETTGSGCGECQQRSRTCNAGCSWGSYGSCTAFGECGPGEFDVDTTACIGGSNGFRIRSCVSCNWGPWGACQYVDIPF